MSVALRSFATLALCGALVAPALAQQRPVVVELFTSQGCSSCPPADEMLTTLSADDDVIVIALHVDYWDYIGWKDQFGDPAHSERQRSYAREAGRRSIFTPEIVVNGQTDIVGAKPMKLANAIAQHKAKGATISLDVTRDGDSVRISATGAQRPADVHMLRLIPSRTTKITRGENRGETIEYTNIATGWRTLDAWDGQGVYTATTKVTGDEPVVVLVQVPEGGPILGAAQID